MRHEVGSIWVGLLLALLAASCGTSESSYEVTTTVISDPAARDLHVWAPDVEGSWPIVYAIPGSGGEADRDLAVLASELASQGVVVLATDWYSVGRDGAMRDAECGYRFARTVARDFGGDLSQPVAMAGFSMGALAVLYQGIGEEEFDDDWILRSGSSVPCFPEASVDRPDVVVAIAGPLSDYGFPSEVQAWGNLDASFTLVTGADDSVCPTRQSEAALTRLDQKGYDATLVEIPDTDHGELVFHDMDNDWAELPPDSEGGQETVRIILEAIKDAQT